MTNIKLSARSDEWYTPKYIIDLVHQVIPQIDLDPASNSFSNAYIKASRYFTVQQDALRVDWSAIPVTIYLNPPGGKVGNKSQTALFWQKLMDLRSQGLLEEAIFMGFSLEHLAVTQGCTVALGQFPICVPQKRIKFVSKEGTFNSPTHSNVIAYIPGISNNTSRFKEVFGCLGTIMHPSNPA
jgi:hypothetical protein